MGVVFVLFVASAHKLGFLLRLLLCVLDGIECGSPEYNLYVVPTALAAFVYSLGPVDLCGVCIIAVVVQILISHPAFVVQDTSAIHVLGVHVQGARAARRQKSSERVWLDVYVIFVIMRGGCRCAF